MPQFTLSDGELVKKTMRTTLIMVGATTMWLGALSGVVVLTTSPASSEASGSKVEGAARGPTPSTPSGPAAIKGAAVKPGRRGGSLPKGASAHAGDPI